MTVMIFVDSHVHIYDCFDVNFLLDSALKNFQAEAKQHNSASQPASYVLLLTECADDDWFQEQLKIVNNPDKSQGDVAGRWCFARTGEMESLLVYHHDAPEEKMYLVAGRQVVSKEKIEVLALVVGRKISDGMSLADTVAAIIEADGIPVLPWGAGKWLGKRGKILKDFLALADKSTLFIGDNGGRPQFWPTPDLFQLAEKKGVSILPGSDPLPLPGEAARVGSFGFYLNDNSAAGDSPAAYLKQVLRSVKTTPVPFGRLQNNSLFVRNQFRLRLSN